MVSQTDDQATIAERFHDLYRGSDTHHGETRLTGETGADGKAIAKSITVRGPATPELWERHLAGLEPSIGIPPIQRRQQVRVSHGNDPAEQVRVSTDELRHRLHGHVGPECQRTLIERRSEGIVHAQDRATLLRCGGALSSGTVLWSNPLPGITSIIPAFPATRTTRASGARQKRRLHPRNRTHSVRLAC